MRAHFAHTNPVCCFSVPIEGVRREGGEKRNAVEETDWFGGRR